MDPAAETPEASAAATLASVAHATTAAPTIPNPLPPGYNKVSVVEFLGREQANLAIPVQDQPICANCSTQVRWAILPRETALQSLFERAKLTLACVQTTPLWRRSHDSTHILCNACALFFKMKGRPRPISLKTDVIKSRNRSKGKSTSKDRGAGSTVTAGRAAGAGAKAKGRGDSTSRSREEDKVGRKSAPGGSEMDDDEVDMDDLMGKKSRKSAGSGGYGMMPMPGYGAGVPGAYPYPYPYQHPHPHQHQPYPPPRSRSRSSSSSRRAPSADSRPGYLPGAPRGAGSEGPPGAPSSPYGYAPPPPGYHPSAPGMHALPPEGYYPYYPPPAGYPGYPGQHPSYYGAPPPPNYPSHNPTHAHAHSLQPPSLTHAQSDSRSRSPSTRLPSEAEDSPRPSISPPESLASTPAHAGASISAGANAVPNPSYYPHPNPSYPHQAALHPSAHILHPYNQSPLSSTTPRIPATNSVPSSATSSGSVPSTATLTNEIANPARLPNVEELRRGERVTLAPMVQQAGSQNGEAAAASGSDSDGSRTKVSLPSIGSVAPSVEHATSPDHAHSAAVPRHTALFEPRFPLPTTSDEQHRLSTSQKKNGSENAPKGDRRRGTSVSSNSAASASGSSEGLRSPGPPAALGLPWGKAASWAAEDERRGRPERRYEDGQGEKGKGREVVELDDSFGDARGQVHERFRMVGVEAGLGELRVDGSPGSAMEQSSRSRSNERGRARGAFVGTGGRSQSSSRVRGRGSNDVRSSSTSSRHGTGGAEAEVARLKTKVAELTFLNSLMQSRLGQLEGPGRVPLAPISGLSGESPEERDEDDAMEEEPMAQTDEDAELERHGVIVKDPAMRAQLLQFFRAQAAAAEAMGQAS